MKDYLIVGQGIAGSVLSMMLNSNGLSHIVISSTKLSNCSNIAAGLFNPVVFKRLVKSWNIDQLLPVAKEFYQQMEAHFGERYFFEQNIIKLFTEEQEIELWKQKLSNEVSRYLDTEIYHEHLEGCKHNGKYGQVNGSGYVNVNRFISKVRDYLMSKSVLIDEAFDHNALVVSEDCVEYKNITARRIVFAEGYKAIDNPYFPKSAFKLTKGEVLTVRIEGFESARTVNKGVFVLPLGNNIYRIGATYNWNELDEKPTQAGLEELKHKLDAIVRVPYEVIRHEAGVRPTIKDRRPAIGNHPKHKNLYFLNGMGTKGVLHAPYCAQHLLSHINTGADIDPEIDIKRFY